MLNCSVGTGGVAAPRTVSAARPSEAAGGSPKKRALC